MGLAQLCEAGRLLALRFAPDTGRLRALRVPGRGLDEDTLPRALAPLPSHSGLLPLWPGALRGGRGRRVVTRCLGEP